jgi:GxxExxY protein
MISSLKYHDITEKILGASFEVHKFLGNGFQEVIYQRALAYEMLMQGLGFKREIEQDIFYKELTEPIGKRRADFVVEGKVLVELKAVIQLEDVHMAQALNYLKAYRLEVGLLINFGSKSLTFKRLILSHPNNPPHLRNESKPQAFF